MFIAQESKPFSQPYEQRKAKEDAEVELVQYYGKQLIGERKQIGLMTAATTDGKQPAEGNTDIASTIGRLPYSRFQGATPFKNNKQNGQSANLRNTIQHTVVKRTGRPQYNPYPLAKQLDSTKKKYETNPVPALVDTQISSLQNATDERKMQQPYYYAEAKRNRNLLEKFKRIREELNMQNHTEAKASVCSKRPAVVVKCFLERVPALTQHTNGPPPIIP